MQRSAKLTRMVKPPVAEGQQTEHRFAVVGPVRTTDPLNKPDFPDQSNPRLAGPFAKWCRAQLVPIRKIRRIPDTNVRRRPPPNSAAAAARCRSVSPRADLFVSNPFRADAVGRYFGRAWALAGVMGTRHFSNSSAPEALQSLKAVSAEARSGNRLTTVARHQNAYSASRWPWSPRPDFPRDL